MTPPSILVPARLARRPVLGTQTDERLVALVRAGHDAAFEAIVARYRRPILRYATRILGDARAEDAVQQTFVNAYHAMLRDDADLRLRPWLYRIAHNTALNALRDWGPGHEQLPESLDGVERPDQTLERRLGLREVLGNVRALPERQRDAILLRELEGRSYDEIAAELGVTGGAVRQLLNRARNALRAGATALTPVGLLARIPLDEASQPIVGRIAEVCGTAGAGATLAKVCATALITTGAVAGGVGVLPNDDRHGPEGAAPAAAATPRASGAAARADAPRRAVERPAVAVRRRAAEPERGDRGPAGGPRERAHREDSDDRGDRDDRDDPVELRDDHSGPGGTGDGGELRSHRRHGGDDGHDDDHSGPGGGSGDDGVSGDGGGGSGSSGPGPGTSEPISEPSGHDGELVLEEPEHELSESESSGKDSSGKGSSGSGSSGSGD
jgi:RNA polymerase sigma factor (sigma-70 family)